MELLIEQLHYFNQFTMVYGRSSVSWMFAVLFSIFSKTGVSIAQMQRELEIKDYKTVWVMAHKIRKAMADRDAQYKLAGLVEIDESFYGPNTSGKRGRGAEKQAKLIIAVSVRKDNKGKERPGFAHAFVADDASAKTIGSTLQRLGVPNDDITPLIGAIRTDGWQSYKAVAKGFGLVHHRVILSDPKDSMQLLPLTHQLIANAKSVFKDHIEAYPQNISKAIFLRSVIASIAGSGIARHFIDC
jgi:hypothetical protein